MAGLRQVWEHHHGAAMVVGLSPSATAAQVLADEIGTECENTAKWLFEHTRNPQRRERIVRLRQEAAQTRSRIRADRLRHQARQLAAEAQRWELRAGQLATPDADASATQALERAWTERHGIATVWGEYATIAAEACGGRYDTLLETSGLTPAQLDQVRHSPALPALLGALRDAEGSGLRLAKAFPQLVQGRPLGSADDLAAVLHGRVQRWTTAASGRDPSAGWIAGLFPPAPTVADADTQQALDERAELIIQRVRHLATLAVQRDDGWAQPLGTPPENRERRQVWLRQLVTVAAYRDRWHITSSQSLGGPPTSEEQATDLHRAREAAQAAIDIHRHVALQHHSAAPAPVPSRTIRPEL